MGQESLDKFDEYLSKVKGMGIDEAVKIKQTALERFNKR
jgi:putative aldouronate transport system substrate-binding protein